MEVMSMNSPAQTGQPVALIDDAERARRRAEFDDLIEIIRPAVQADGGDLEVLGVNVERGIVEVQLTGACGSCAASSMTLDDGLTRILTDRLSWVREVRGGVDDSMSPDESAALGRGAYVSR